MVQQLPKKLLSKEEDLPTATTDCKHNRSA